MTRDVSMAGEGVMRIVTTVAWAMATCAMAGGCASEPAGCSCRTGCQAASGPAGGDNAAGDGWVKLTAGACAEMTQRAADAPGGWIVMYNGTCSGAPALGIHPAAAHVPDDAVAVEVRGVALLIEADVAGLQGLWGDLVIDFQKENGGVLTAAFTVEEVPGWTGLGEPPPGDGDQ